MNRLTENKIVLIVRKTRLDGLKGRYNTERQAQFYVEHLGADFNDYQDEDITYKAAVQQTTQVLSKLGRVQVIERSFLPNYVFGENDTVVVLGQDGLVANVLKYLENQPVLGVNPDPGRYEGILLPFAISELFEATQAVFRQKCSISRVTMAKAELNTGEALFGVNDLFIGPKTHTSARYSLEIGGRSEEHSSSGIIVSTGLGSTGWLRSIIAGATGISSQLSGANVEIREQEYVSWNSNFLYFSVREPWPSKVSSAEITFGKITQQKPLRLISQMPENGVIFSDGMESDFIEFNSGALAEITVAKKKGHLVQL